MRFILLIFLLGAPCLAVFGQNEKLDSIENSLAYMGNGAKAKYFINLAHKRIQTRCADAIEFAQKAASLANISNNSEFRIEAQDQLAEAYLLDRDTNRFILALEEKLSILNSVADTSGAASTLLRIGQFNFHLGNLDKSETVTKSALTAFQSVKDTLGIAATHHLLADIFQTNDEEKAANMHLGLALDLMNGNAVSQKSQLQLLQIQNRHDKRIRGLLFVLIGIAGLLAAMLSILYRRKQADNHKMAHQIEENRKQRFEIEELGKEQEMKNISLDLLNKKLVDEMAARESMQRFSHSKDRYLAAITNEMRSPLNDIAGLAHLLLESNPRPDQVDQIRVVQFCANELTSLTNEALGYSSFEDAKFGSEDREFDLFDVTNQVFERIENRAETVGIHFHHTIDETIPKWLIGNGPRLSNVLTNLLSNCLDTTPTGLVNVTVVLANLTEKETVVKFTIEAPDKGVLSNFYHHKNLNDKNGGASSKGSEDKILSLAMTKRMVEVQAGKMQVEKLLDVATRITLLIPYAIASEFHGVYHSSEDKYEGLQGARVLLVEDNKINQVVVVKMLQKYGANVATAENGFEALDLLTQQVFDIVLMDIQMPGMDGYRATSEIRSHPSPAINSLPIIALTSSAYIVEKEKALLFGMNDYIGKPYRPDELLDKLCDCLELNRKIS